MCVGKLFRNEMMKDTVEIDAVNEAHSKPDSVSGSKETQLARFLFKNGKLIKPLSKCKLPLKKY